MPPVMLPLPPVPSVDAPTMVTTTPGNSRISTSFDFQAPLHLDSHVAHSHPSTPHVHPDAEITLPTHLNRNHKISHGTHNHPPHERIL